MSKVMVVDDDSMILRMASFILKKGGHTACTAQSGEEALGKIGGEQPDAVFIDNEMPGMSGLQLLGELRSRDDLRAVKMCIMTGTLTDDIKDQASKLGAVGCIKKPINAAEMLELIG